MFLRMVRRSIARGWRKKGLAIMTVAIGTSLAVAMLSVAMDIGDNVNRELKSYGANILVAPEVEAVPVTVDGADYNPLASQSYLREDKLPGLKMIFWRHNIIGFAPYLAVRAEAADGRQVPLVGTWFSNTLVIPTGETVTAGVRDLKGWWQVDGAWPDDDADDGSAMAGQAIAERFSLQPGDSLTLTFPGQSRRSQTLAITGVVAAGGDEDQQVFVPLSWLQKVMALDGKVSRVEVSALTMPKNELARKAERLGPDTLSRDEFDTWYCSPYVDSVAYQIEEVIPGARARPIRQIAESEGTILGKVQLLMGSLALAALTSAALGISGLMSAAALERSREIGLLKAMGAYNSSVTWLFMAEATVIGALGGVAGWVIGLGLARFVAQSVFGASLHVNMLTIPAALGISVAVALLGSLSAARLVSRLDPARVLTGGGT